MFHYVIAVAGGTEIPLAPCALFDTAKLADNMADVLERFAGYGQNAQKSVPKKRR